MTCSKNFGRLLQVTCLGLIGMLATVGCGGSETTNHDGSPGASGEVGPGPGVANVNVSPPSADFGSVVKGASSATPTVITVTNRGAATSLSPSATGPFAIVSTTCGTLAALGTCTISLSFTPIAVGPASGVLTVATGVNVTLTGTGVAPGAFSVTDKVDLGTVLVGATAPGSITVTALSAISGLSCTTSGADIAADATKVCPATLAAGASCVFGFNFKAATVGVKNDSVVCSATGTTLSSTVTANVVTPANLVFQAPATVAVGTPVNTLSSVISFNLVNTGGSSSGVLTVTPSDATQFVVDNQCIVPLAASSFCKINVVFRPTTAGPKTLTLTVTDASAPLTSVVATVNGTATPPGSLTLTGTGDFGTVAVGATSAPATVFTVTNPGQSDTGIITIGVTNAMFVVTADGCSGSPLAATKSCTVSVVFKPTAAGPAGGNLSASAPGTAAAALPLSGLATGAAALALAPSTLDFGGLVVNTTSGSKTFTVTNTGQNATGALEIVKADSTSSVGGGSQFSYTTTCAASLLPNATCAVVVTFAPLQVGSASATITVRTVDRTIASQAGTLLGLGLATADLVLDCGSTGGVQAADFGTAGTVVGQTSNPITCTLTNTANTASGAIVSKVTGDFAIATDNCATANLQNNTSCTLVVTFKPTAKGARTGVISVSSANSGSTNQQATGIGLGVVEVVALTGTGCVPTTLGQPITCTVATQPYDFGQVSVGTTSAATTALTLQVWVRGSVGNMAIAKAFGTPAEFTTTTLDTCTSLSGTGATGSLTAPFCYAVVNFAPQAKGAQAGSVTATGADGTTDNAKFQGTGTGPLTISPSPLNFDAVPIGSAGAAMTLTVCNNAATNATGATVALGGANAADFVVVSDPVSNATIDTGTDGCKLLQLRLVIPATETAGARAATLTVSATVAGAVETAVVNLVGSAGSGPALSATLAGAFADTAISAVSAPVTVNVGNTGGLGTAAISYQIPASSQFTMCAPAGQSQSTCAPTFTAGACAAVPTTGVETATSAALPPAGSCKLFLWFKPVVGLGVGERDSTLTVSSAKGGIQILNLTANATSQLVLTPSVAQDFGSVALLSATSATKSFTITNNGAAVAASDLGIAFVNVGSQVGSADFRIISDATDTCTAGLGAVGSVTSPAPACTFNVQMYANTAGVRTTTLQVANTNGSDTTVLTGTALAPAALQFTSTTAMDRDFGSVRVGDASSTITYTVKNVGGVQAGVLSYGLFDVSATTAHVGDFGLTTTCPTDSGLLASASCNIAITFQPNACAGSSCTATPLTQMTEYLVVKASPGAPTTGVTVLPVGGAVPKITALAIARTSPYVVEQVGAAPYNFGTAAKTATFVIRNPSAAAVTLGATPTFLNDDPLPTGGVAAVASEFVAANGTVTGGCVFGVTSLPAGSETNPTSCTFTVAWNPAAASAAEGKKSVTLTTSVGTATPTTIPVSMRLYATTLAAAHLTASPVASVGAPLDFGNVAVAATSPATTVTLVNDGESDTAALVVAKAATAQSGMLLPATTGGCAGAVLHVGDTCTVSVAVKPTAAGSGVGAFTVGTATINAKWVGTIAAAVSPDVASQDFGKVPVLVKSTPVTINIANVTNGQPTGALSFAVGAGDVDFAVTAPVTGCGDPVLAVNGLIGGANCDIQVTFTPTALATPAKTGTLTITSASGATSTVDLTGTAIADLSNSAGAVATTTAEEDPLGNGTAVAWTAATATATAAAAYAAGSITASTFGSATFTITNATGAPATGLLVTGLSGTDAGQFRIITDGCIGNSLAAAGPCKVTVRFAPTTTGAKTATLTVSGTPGDSVSIKLTGTANP